MTNNAGYVKVLTAPKKGRYLVAITDIPQNTVIIKDPAYASVSKLPQFCSSCFNRLTKPRIKRPFLCAVCHTDGPEPFNAKEKSLVVLCYSVAQRVVSESGFSYAKYVEFVNRCPPEKSEYSCDFTAISQLVTQDLEVDQCDIDRVCDLLALQLDNTLAKGELQYLVKHIFSTFPCNVQGVTCIVEAENGAYVERRVGSGIYPMLALMNHSCYPNTRIHFDKSTVVVTTTEHVKAGDELFHNYGPNVLHQPRRQRQELLSHQYGFKCDCSACSVGGNKEPAYSLKCEKCYSLVWIDDEDLICASCQSQIQTDRYYSRMDSIITKLCTLEESPCDVKFLNDVVHEAKALYSSESVMLGNIMDSCASLYAAKNDWAKSIECSRISCNIVKSLAGSLSHTYAFELVKFCGLRIKFESGSRDHELIKDVKFALNTLQYCKIYDSKNIELLRCWLTKYG